MTLHIDAGFDGGNIRVIAIDGDRIDLEIAKDHQSDFFQWFYFRVAGAKGGAMTTRLIHWFVGKYGVNMDEAANPASAAARTVSGNSTS